MHHEINWTQLFESLSAFPGCDYSNDRMAQKALERIIGKPDIIKAVKHYLARKKGSELVRLILVMIRSDLASEYCWNIYKSSGDLETKRAAVELLRFASSSQGMKWVRTFLRDKDPVVQVWGFELVETLLRNEMCELKDIESLLKTARRHNNSEVRDRVSKVLKGRVGKRKIKPTG